MKLLFCRECHDIFRLYQKERKCKCKKSKGKYLNGLDAVYSGPCVPVGFANSSFVDAVIEQPESGMGKEFKAFVIPKVCPTFIKEN